MNTWKTVLNLEWKILKRDRSALAVLLIFAAFLTLAALAGGHHASNLATGLERSEAEETTRLKNHQEELARLAASNKRLSSKDPRNTVWMGQEGAARLALLPPSPLAPIALGQRDLHPQAVRVTSGMNLIRERETETPMAGPTRLQTGAFDPAFLFVVLFPLVVIALSYELLSGERERGTLAMLLSQPVSQSALILGKASARLIALCGITLLFALIGLIVGGAELTGVDAGLHILFYAGLLVSWAAFWFAAAIAVNSRGGGSAKNALVLVGLWLILVVVVPGLINVGVNSFYPPPSRIELLHEAREAAQDVEKELNTIEGRHDVDPKAGEAAKKVISVQEELAKRSEPVLKELNEELRARQEILDALRFLSPAILIQMSLEDIAGAGSVRHDRFESQADQFHKEFRDFFTTRIQADSNLELKDLKVLPKFIYEEEPVADLASRVLSSILALLMVSALLVIAARPGLNKIGRLAR
ncbi:MAG: ABC transporter permease subunit [Deltaproteobacteria bacterium]|jgi:ABC-2 type transport system permease protein|nr:ABC transporter permease subunit [Deltaproteobacteria bacterium]MBT6489494.1 ABC transporter permease subunit [Deltaproteobacteria bacterium]